MKAFSTSAVAVPSAHEFSGLRRTFSAETHVFNIAARREFSTLEEMDGRGEQQGLGYQQQGYQQQSQRQRGSDQEQSRTWKFLYFKYPTLPICISCTANFHGYRKTEILEKLAKERYGPSIFVLGSTLDQIREFWKFISYEVKTIEEPRVVAKTKVDIDSKCHQNFTEPGDGISDDEIEIKSKKIPSGPKSVTLQVPKMHGFHIGGSTGISAKPGFFNLAEGAGIAAEDGINSSHGFHQVNNNESLSQGYTTMEVLKVRPGKKVKAEITTWAVTYEASTITKFTVDAHAHLPVQYRSLISRLVGGCYISTGYLTAMDIFADEDRFQFDPMHNTVTFTRVGRVSYLGEEVDIKKNDQKLPTNLDDM